VDTCGNAWWFAVLRGYCVYFSNCGVDMTTFCHECGRYQGHEKKCSQSEQVTIDDLSHENSLIRARNERLAREADALSHILTLLLAMCERQVDFNDDRNGDMLERSRAAIVKHTGSST
jgi:hypothetical protein